MGALFAGIIRAPLTSVFMIFEITQDYQILVPLMVANLLSFMISRRYQPVPIYHALLEQDGIHLPPPLGSERPVEWTAGSAMSNAFVILPADMALSDAAAHAAAVPDQAVFVGTPSHVTGLALCADLEAATWRDRGQEPLGWRRAVGARCRVGRHARRRGAAAPGARFAPVARRRRRARRSAGARGDSPRRSRAAPRRSVAAAALTPLVVSRRARR